MEHIHLTIHLGEDVERLLHKTAKWIVAAIREKESEIMPTLNEILEIATASSTKIDSINAIMDGMRQQIADLLAGAISPELQAQIDAVFEITKANADKVQEAIDENTSG